MLRHEINYIHPVKKNKFTFLYIELLLEIEI